jgi:RNA 3'-phosphate cyclase
MIKLDGSYLEGGGSIARVALALSTLTQKPFEITNIRKNRPQPGLKHQHLFCIKALEKLCNAKVQGSELGSTYLNYIPGKIQGKTIDIDIQTAGSISLFLQAILLPSMFADKLVKLNITGGTSGKWAAPVEYFKEIFLPQLQKYSDLDCKLIRRGYYPKGNGKVEITIRPKYKITDFSGFEEFHAYLKENAPKINLTEPGNLTQIKGISHAALDLEKASVAERQAKSAESLLKKYEVPINIQAEYSKVLSIGSGILVWAKFSKNNDIDMQNPVLLGSGSLGERGKKAESVGIEAANGLIKEIDSKAAVDSHLADQILKFMSLAGKSSIKTSSITSHTKTNIYVIEKFFGKTFEIQDNMISTVN